ncbi:uncharacterized protein F5Z01DRAFT_666723 [Emericellopsis atlantica]|uniref:Uncharacterized protein n=1 Tax=Emericellopsis atlantica TaxID=2614577 RepID=A0A9P8CM42_9HYPO|nr:uncharacterized protein F5Z01DRAFT_666723 [Emericellopsis atlantica]KAG9250276.1 hypothetical protein F5Z01DRAFT_666723 [Emericellopsis atlantica]
MTRIHMTFSFQSFLSVLGAGNSLSDSGIRRLLTPVDSSSGCMWAAHFKPLLCTNVGPPIAALETLRLDSTNVSHIEIASPVDKYPYLYIIKCTVPGT